MGGLLTSVTKLITAESVKGHVVLQIVDAICTVGMFRGIGNGFLFRLNSVRNNDCLLKSGVSDYSMLL